MSLQDPPDPTSKKQRTLRSVPTSLAARGLELFRMAAKVGGKTVLGEEAQRRTEQAQALVEGLARLKGAAMKLGQTMSVELRDLLPPEFVDALSKLQDQGTALSGESVRAILKEEWGNERFRKLETFVDAPLASASIGQVHAARLDGRDLVIKVQFPGIAKTVDSDIQGVGLLLRTFLAFSGRDVRLDSFLEEMKVIFKQETDYQQECQFLKEYRTGISAFPGFRVPEVYSEFTTPRVLTMSRERGLKPLDWMKLRNPSQKVRNAVGLRFLDLYEIEFFQMGLVQTDPNFANFLIDDSQDRENPEITLLDFGAVKRYDEPFRQGYRELLSLGRTGTDAQLLEKCFAMELLDRSECEAGQTGLIRLMRASLRPFDPAVQPFRFTDQEYSQEMREMALELSKACRVSPPPRTILFLHRKLGGIFNLLKAMEVELDLTDYWERIVTKSSSKDSETSA